MPEVPANLIYELPSITERLDLAQLFPKGQPLEVELGCGDAGFLIEYAARHPERNFIGVERLLGRLRKLDRKGRRAGLTNLRGVRLECGYLLEWLLPLHSVAALHVYFPDPWPKKKHRRRRLVNERFPALARQALLPGGAVYLRTDDADYFAQMTEVFAAAEGFHKIETPSELATLLTDFEKDFQSRGVVTLRVAYACVEPLNPGIVETAGRPQLSSGSTASQFKDSAVPRFGEAHTSITGPPPSLRGGRRTFCR